jgi:hypothetical protein
MIDAEERAAIEARSDAESRRDLAVALCVVIESCASFAPTPDALACWLMAGGARRVDAERAADLYFRLVQGLR